MHEISTVRKGDRVELRGGYNFEPEWLAGKQAVNGNVLGFIPGQNDQPAALVKLNSPVRFEEVTGDVVVLELRYAGATWAAKGVVHVELCDFFPEPKPWKERRKGKWVESNASYQLVGSQANVHFPRLRDVPIESHRAGIRSRFKLPELSILLSLSACSPTTSVRNDTKTPIYVVIIKNGVPRRPSPQKVLPDEFMTAPWPPREASMLYVGTTPDRLRRFTISNLCDQAKRNCDLRASELPTAKSNGS